MGKPLVAGIVILGIISLAAPLGAVTSVAGAPTITSVTPGPRTITVTFKKPAKPPAADDLYTAVCSSSDNGVTRSGEGFTSPIRVLGLSAGHVYVCRMRVILRGSYGPWSPKSATVVPLKEQTTTVPDPPAVISATHSGKETIKVTFKRLDHSGGLEVTRYVAKCVSSNGGSPNKQQRAKSPIYVDHLTGGKTYTCRVAARNAKGFGEFSAPSKPVVTLTS